MGEIKRNLGKKIKYYRELKGLTQEKLAEKLDLNCRSLSFIECGVNFVTEETLEKLCSSLDVTPKQLFDFNYLNLPEKDIKNRINQLIDTNKEKLNDVYKILKGFLD